MAFLWYNEEMVQIKNHIVQLLDQNLFIDSALKKSVVNNLETLSQEKVLNLEEVLTRALHIQHKLLVDLVKRNPNLSSELKQSLQKTTRKELETREQQSCQEDKTILAGLENELRNLFQ